MKPIRSKTTMLTAAGMTAVWLVSVVLAASGTTSSSAPSATHSAGILPARAHTVAPISISQAFQQAARPAAQAPAAAGPAPQMVENVFKNIQVLKGVTVDDFMGTMGLMSASLAFCCSDCHNGAGTDTVKWEEDNANKKMARKMVTMVQTINKENFGGRQVVTCWSCHRGRDKPVITPGLDSVYSTPVVEEDDVQQRAAGVPALDDVLNKYYTAIGGLPRANQLTSFAAKGQVVGFGGFGGGAQVEIFAKAPNMRATYIHFPDDPERGDDARTFDGMGGWIATPHAVLRQYQLTGGELDGARVDAQLSFPGQIKTVLTNLRVIAPTLIDDKATQVVQGNGARNSVATLYFDQVSGLLTRVVRMTPSPIGRIPTQVDYSDYRDVNGLKMPFHFQFSWLDGRDAVQLSDVQMNVAIDAAKFGKPDPFAKK
jgi:hypothetical protein